MFTCKACVRRALTPLVNDTLRLEKTSITPQLVYAALQPRQRKRYATATASARTTRQDEVQNAAQEGRKVRRMSLEEWAAYKQLQYLKDPLHIAEYVNNALEKGNFEEAALITRKASKNMNVVVSWNHLIDYQLQHDKIHAGIKLFNEMKKRSQLPNAQTFTVIFRGCAASSHPKLAVAEVVRLYNTMLTRERIKPNGLHMNAVLQVCAMAGDLDTMFNIVDTANDGLRAPTNFTYTTILNALRSRANVPHPEFATEVDVRMIEDNKDKAIQRAKSLWEEVIMKWRAGTIFVDEELVCAMGRILLIGSYHDAKAVEALLEQTMPILRKSKTATTESSTDAVGFKEGETGSPKVLEAPAFGYAYPGNNSLSMILSALEKTGSTTKCDLYWDIFTKQHRVVPDANNWHQLLKTLRRGKNSAKTASYLREMPAKLMVPKNFRVAMSTCKRDNLNGSAFDHATEVLNIMTLNLKVPDLPTMRAYLQAAYSSKQHFIKSKRDRTTAEMEWGQRLATAIDNLWRPYMVAQRELNKEPEKEPEKESKKETRKDKPEQNQKQELVALARKMIAACDKLIFGKLVPPEVEKRLKLNRNAMHSFVFSYFEQMMKIDPNFKFKDKDEEEEAGWEGDADNVEFEKNFIGKTR